MRTWIAALVTCSALVCAPAQANTISIVDGAGVTAGSLTTAGSIVGFVPTGGCNVDNTPLNVCELSDTPFTTSVTTASRIEGLANSNPSTETAAMNAIAGTALATGTQSGSNPSNPLSISTPYFSLKLGSSWAFFQNLSGVTLSLTYTEVAGQGAGLSHFTSYGTLTAVPGPIAGAGIPGLIAAFGALVALARRRRAAALA